MGGKARSGGWAVMMCGAAILAGGWTLLAAVPASAAKQSLTATGSGYGSYNSEEDCCYFVGNHAHGVIWADGDETGAFDGEWEAVIYFSASENGSFVANGTGEFAGTIQGCGRVEENFSIYGTFKSRFNSFTGGTSGKNPVLFEQTITFGSGNDFGYQAAWVACSSHA
jgi:hypothetical protein